MRPSPLQLQHVIYNKVSILPSARAKGAELRHALGFDFEGVNIQARIATALKEGQTEDPRDFLVTLDITLDNTEGKPTPYGIDVSVSGVFKVLPSLPIERREDLVTVNGASILYGAIRELVLTLTSRFGAGGLTLPGMNFEDNAPSKRRATNAIVKTPAVEAPKSAKPARKVRRTS